MGVVRVVRVMRVVGVVGVMRIMGVIGVIGMWIIVFFRKFDTSNAARRANEHPAQGNALGKSNSETK